MKESLGPKEEEGEERVLRGIVYPCEHTSTVHTGVETSSSLAFWGFCEMMGMRVTCASFVCPVRSRSAAHSRAWLRPFSGSLSL